jgi:Cu/Ag efflux protein CusF
MTTMMRALSASVVALSLLTGGVAMGQQVSQQTPPDLCAAHQRAKAHAPKMIRGRVVNVDTAAGTVTLQDAGGKVHEFRASAETLQTMKTGDQIEANLRPTC